MKTIAIFDDSMKLLNKVLDLRAENEKVIASNIANSETPGYAPAKFVFEEELKHAITKGGHSITTTHQQHFPVNGPDFESVTGKIRLEPDTTQIGDQNAVSLDEEMMNLSKNELLYETSAQLLKKKLNILKYVVQGGG